MTLSTTSNRITYSGNGATTTFSFDFPGVAASDLVITYVDADGNSTIIDHSQLTIILTAPVAPNPTGIGGSVTYPLSGSPIATGTTLTIARELPVVQATSLANQGTLWQTVVEQALDYITMLIQQQQAQTQRAYTIPATDPDSILTEVPSYTARALQMFGWDSDGNPIAAQPSSALISAAMQPVVAAPTIPAAVALLGINSTGTTYDDRAALAAATVDPGVSIVFTSAYAIARPGIGGAAFYRVGGSTTGGVQSADGQWWAMPPTLGSPDQMGAIGDGAINGGTGAVTGTDDTAAIQNAINYFAVCQFQRTNKIYKIARAGTNAWAVHITTSNHWVYGNGATLALADSAWDAAKPNLLMVHFVGVNAGNRIVNIHIDGLNLYGNCLNQGAADATNEYNGYQLTYCDNFTVARCNVYSTCGDGMAFGGSVGGRVVNNRVERCGKNCIYFPAGDSSSLLALGNDCRNPNHNFGGVSPFFGGVAYSGISLSGISETCVGNTISCGNEGQGIAITAVAATNPADCICVGNTILNPLGNGIILLATPANATTTIHCTIANNTIVSAGSNGIEVNWVSQFAVTGNTIFGAGNIGILLNGRATVFTVTGNVVNTSTLSGIGCYGSRLGLVSDNTLYANGAYGIDFGNSEALGVNANQDITIGSNALLSNVSGDINGANLVLYSVRTKATLRASFTYDPPNTADKAVWQTTQTLAEATTSTTGSATHTTVGTGAWILSSSFTAGNITVTGLNWTGGAVDLAPGVLHVVYNI